MPGPNGEKCGTCYYFQAGIGNEGTCRFPPVSDVVTQGQSSWWKATDAEDGWCGEWRDQTSPVRGFLATAGLITPTDTAYSITGGSTWQHYNPGNMYDSSIVYNCTTANDTITWSIPGTFPPGTLFVADYSVFGSILYPTTATDVQWSLGPSATNLPFSNDIFQEVDITNQVDDISLPFGFGGGPAISSQTGDVRVLVRSANAENITVESLFFQIRVSVL